jgi:hypothetical protein
MTTPEDLPEASHLAALESFDPDVLRPSNKDEREVCSFILALALAYNDVKDCRLALSALRPYLPKTETISAAAGQGFGLETHLLRHFYAVLYELIRLIEENPKPQSAQPFKDTITSLAKEDRNVWHGLVNLAIGGPKGSGLLRALIRVRDNTASHYYGLKGLAEGYDSFFSKKAASSTSAYLSRGINAAESRFYFADAAGQGYQNLAVKSLSKGELDALSKNVSLALFQIVTRFIERRAGGFYQVEKKKKGA